MHLNISNTQWISSSQLTHSNYLSWGYPWPRVLHSLHKSSETGKCYHQYFTDMDDSSSHFKLTWVPRSKQKNLIVWGSQGSFLWNPCWKSNQFWPLIRHLFSWKGRAMRRVEHRWHSIPMWRSVGELKSEPAWSFSILSKWKSSCWLMLCISILQPTLPPEASAEFETSSLTFSPHPALKRYEKLLLASFEWLGKQGIEITELPIFARAKTKHRLPEYQFKILIIRSHIPSLQL